jgi:hypothetical protein
MTDDPEPLVGLWSDRARRSEAAHYQTAARYSLYHSVLAFGAVALSAVTASGLFASTKHTNGPYRVTFGVLGILAAVVAGLDRGQRFAERSEQHRAAGAKWAVIVNATEELSLRPPHRLSAKDFDAMRSQLDDTTGHSPALPQWVFDRNRLGECYLAAYQPRRSRLRRRLRKWAARDDHFEQQAGQGAEPLHSDRT